MKATHNLRMSTARSFLMSNVLVLAGPSRTPLAPTATRISSASSATSRTFATARPMQGRSRSGVASSTSAWRTGNAKVSVSSRIGIIQVRTMFIQTESTPNEDSLKFLPGQKVMDSGSAEFTDTRAAMVSPLAKQLFQITGVRGVFFGPDFVTVSKDSEAQWPTLKPEIYSTIMEFFTAGHALFIDAATAAQQGSSDTIILDTDSETVAMIKELLDTRVRPAIQEDGGDLEYRGFGEDTDGIVRVKLKGSCRGCDSSTVTLKSGIERMLMHYIPEVKGVEQILDQEEEIALDEFAKLEQKLAKDRERETARGFSL